MAREARDAYGDETDITYGESDYENKVWNGYFIKSFFIILSQDDRWEFDKMFGCLCDGDPSYSYSKSGPIAHLSGSEANNPPLSGYSGYDCSRSSFLISQFILINFVIKIYIGECPKGNDPSNNGTYEVQALVCTGAAPGTSFTLSFRGESTSVFAFSYFRLIDYHIYQSTKQSLVTTSLSSSDIQSALTNLTTFF